MTFEIKIMQIQNQKGFILYQEHPVMQTLPRQFALLIWRRAGEAFILFTMGGN